MKRTIIISLLTVLATSVLMAQAPQVRVSQYAEVKQRIGLTDISIIYHRPGVKGRAIWGDLLKYNEVWRAGANEPTLITFSDTVRVNGATVAPGQYRFLVIPKASGPWTVIFNSEVKNWGTIYDSTYDVIHTSLTPVSAPHEEWMSFTFSDLSYTSCTLALRWEKLALQIPIEINTAGKLAFVSRTAQNSLLSAYNSQARFLIDNNGDMGVASQVADKALAIDENAATLRNKAEVLAKTGKLADAIVTLEKAVQVGKQRNPQMNTAAFDALLKEWKAKGGKK